MNDRCAIDPAVAAPHPDPSSLAPRVWARHRRCRGWCSAFAFEQLGASAVSSPRFKEIARQRFRVYCEERGFLPADAYRDGLETDCHDPHAMHFAARYRGQVLVGSVRLVRADEHGMFPFQRHCTIYPHARLPRAESAAEISRLIIDQAFRATVPAPCRICAHATDHREDSSSEFDAGHPRQGQRDSTEIILMGLHDRLLDASRRAGIRHWYAAMEPALARMFRRLGFPVRAIGPTADYYGHVRPYVVDCAAMAGHQSSHAAASRIHVSEHLPITDERVLMRTFRSTEKPAPRDAARSREASDRHA